MLITLIEKGRGYFVFARQTLALTLAQKLTLNLTTVFHVKVVSRLFFTRNFYRLACGLFLHEINCLVEIGISLKKTQKNRTL